MAEIKLSRLPDRNPVKLSIAVLPDFHQALIDYAALYASTYGREEPISELIPGMLAGFLASDRAFARVRTTSLKHDQDDHGRRLEAVPRTGFTLADQRPDPCRGGNDGI